MRKTMCISLSNNSTSSVSTKTSEQRCLLLFDAVRLPLLLVFTTLADHNDVYLYLTHEPDTATLQGVSNTRCSALFV
jgi:hypothetical protein